MNTGKYILTLLCLTCLACTGNTTRKVPAQTTGSTDTLPRQVLQPSLNISTYDSGCKTIHVFVALCDNKYQGIVPVPEKIGNGQDPDNNLYWGCGYGVRSYFKKSPEWIFLGHSKPDTTRLERLIFKHKTQNYYLVADAYDGRYIKQCTIDFLNSAAGIQKDTLHVGGHTIGIDGNARLVAYIGHDGLMDFELTEHYNNADHQKRDCIILACSSRNFFTPYMHNAGANPLLWTSSLMCPEAYTLHDALSGYIQKENAIQIQKRAVKAYVKYQKMNVGSASDLLVTGW